MRRRLLKVLFGVAGLAFLVVTFLDSWDRSQGLPIVAWPRLLLAGAAVLVALFAGLWAWGALLDVRVATVAPGFMTSQLGKYVPGGVWQAVGQVGYAASDAVSVKRASVGFVTFAVTQAVSGALLGSLVAVAPGPVPGWVRLTAAGGLLALIVLRRGWLVRVVGWAARLRGAEDAPEELVPSQGAIIRATAWGMLSLLAVGIAFAATLATDLPRSAWLTVVVAFVVAWTVGFLAIPVPAGVGVREGVLILVLGPVVASSTLVAASVVLRLVAMAAEAVAIAGTRLWARATGAPVSRRATVTGRRDDAAAEQTAAEEEDEVGQRGGELDRPDDDDRQ